MKAKGGTSKKKRVFVGMSGGVDSSVSAALLKERGFDVTGVFIKVWQPEWLENTAECTWREDRLDAMRVCVHLGIPFMTLDLEEEYKKEVVDYMISEYRAGRTPNPDVMCNRHVKFGGFFDWAMKQGADYVATGHYARIRDGADGPSLLAGKDGDKDQSYFLWTLTKRELSKTLFPIGDIEKPEVRRIAQRIGLPVADKRDSQGLCFMGKIDLKEFLSHYIERKKGPVLDESGQVIGEHDGALFLTIGERRGFTVLSKSSSDKPYYVISRDIDRNSITVSHAQSSERGSDGRIVGLESVNWISGAPEEGKKYRARIRHRQPFQNCILRNGSRIEFDEPQIAAPGQSVVVYDGETCLGGGTIKIA